jgi:squalene-hopene/tetraprenyl-beta-curcumene cyclase
LGVQNREGGIPTFCRGWTNLPFDRSSADLTAHTLRAWAAWHPAMPAELQGRMDRACGRALVFLVHRQREDGSWLPLWFGNQDVPGDENPLYATARCVTALAQFAPFAARRWPGGRHKPLHLACLEPAIAWLIRSQNPDGSWGGAGGITSSVEETALAVEALADARICLRSVPDAEFAGSTGARDALRCGADWLASRVENGRWREPSPIGFYFAKLWYFEKLYPVIFTTAALGRAAEALESS